MANEFLAVSDGTFTLSETKVKNQFYFYRNDGRVLTDIDNEPIDLYDMYIRHKMMTGEITDMVMKDIYLAKSYDGKHFRLTVCDIGEKPPKIKNSNVKKPNFIKRLFHRIG